MRSLSDAADISGFYLLAFCVVVAPVPLGSNDASLAGLLGLFLSMCLLGTVFVPVTNVRVRRLLRATLLLAGLIIAICILQSIPRLSAASVSPIWNRFGALNDSLPGSISVSRNQPLHSAGYVLIPLAGFMSSLVYVRDNQRCMWFFNVILGSGFAVTVACMGQYFLFPDSLLWNEKKHYLGSFTGTFVNANTAATYYGLLLLISISMVAGQLRRVGASRRSPHSQYRSPEERQNSRTLAVYLVWAFAFGIALLLTKSRGGVLSAMVGVALFAMAAAFLQFERKFSPIKMFGVAFGCIMGMFVFVSLYGDGLLFRLYREGLDDASWLCAYKSTWNAIMDHFWWGAGFGTFQDIFPMYRMVECGLDGYWEMAHSVFIEAWLGLGVVFLAVVLIVYAQLIKTYVRGLRERDRFRFVPLACLGIVVLLTIHSLVDFSLQIPGVALLAAAALASGAAVSVARGSGEALTRGGQRGCSGSPTGRSP